MLRKVLVGHVGVDSGQIMVCDPCYIKHWNRSKEEAKPGQSFDEAVEEAMDTFSYLGACYATLKSPHHADQFDLGVAVSSGYGDGEYPVYVTIEDGRIKKLEVKFF